MRISSFFYLLSVVILMNYLHCSPFSTHPLCFCLFYFFPAFQHILYSGWRGQGWRLWISDSNGPRRGRTDGSDPNASICKTHRTSRDQTIYEPRAGEVCLFSFLIENRLLAWQQARYPPWISIYILLKIPNKIKFENYENW